MVPAISSPKIVWIDPFLFISPAKLEVLKVEWMPLELRRAFGAFDLFLIRKTLATRLHTSVQVDIAEVVHEKRMVHDSWHIGENQKHVAYDMQSYCNQTRQCPVFKLYSEALEAFVPTAKFS